MLFKTVLDSEPVSDILCSMCSLAETAQGRRVTQAAQSALNKEHFGLTDVNNNSNKKRKKKKMLNQCEVIEYAFIFIKKYILKKM